MLDTPFTISPDPLALYLTSTLKSALLRTKLTIEHRQGIAAILGDVGLGKSTLLRYLHTHYSAQPNVETRLVAIPKWPSGFAMMKSICMEFGRPEARRSLAAQMESFQNFLVEQYKEGRNVVLFIDEAQVLNNDQLELIRMLLNFETNTAKLLQIIMAGQLDLRDRLRHPRNKALLSRIFAPTVVTPLTEDEMIAMLETRCRLADIESPFEREAVTRLYQVSMGVPRTALRVSAIAWAMVQALGWEKISGSMIDAVIQEGKLDDEPALVPNGAA